MNPFSKKGLGRGLSSLIGDAPKIATTNKLSISDITRNKHQPRKSFDKESLEELTNSIKERGIIQPIIVRQSEDQTGKHEIVAGERRWLAAQNAGLHEVPVVVIQADSLKSLEFAIVENVQRHDLNPIEEAEGYQRLIEEFNYDQENDQVIISEFYSTDEVQDKVHNYYIDALNNQTLIHLILHQYHSCSHFVGHKEYSLFFQISINFFL